jgi:hypothetical protein
MLGQLGVHRMKKLLVCILFVLLSSHVIAEEHKEFFDEEEIILETIEKYPKFFRIKRHKYYYISQKEKSGPYQKTSVEMQQTCTGVGIKSPSGQQNIIGWTTADERLIPPHYHVFAPSIRVYHRIDLSALEYQFMYLGRLSRSGEFITASEKSYGKTPESNKKIIKLKMISEDWNTYFSRMRKGRVC